MSTEAWLRLLAAATTGKRNWLQALRQTGDADTLLGLSRPSLAAAGLTRQQIECLHPGPPVPECWQRWLGQPGHRLITCPSGSYPERLASLVDAPLALWARGSRPDLLDSPQLAIVGSRHPTGNGLVLAEEMASALSRSGLTVTSGLARGIDAASHRGALKGCAGTIAVLGTGIDRIYPNENHRLAESIEAHGVIVSEYPPGTPVRPGQFPRRNRIIAGLSLGVLVVEATRRSGSLITARMANDYGREVFAIPGSVHSTLSKGCHKLIQDGAKLVEQTLDVVTEIAPQLAPLIAENGFCGRLQQADELPDVLGKHLDFSPAGFDSLLAASGLTAAELSSMLLHLELEGKIEALPGGRYCRLAKRS